jgi:hypothetical protein
MLSSHLRLGLPSGLFPTPPNQNLAPKKHKVGLCGNRVLSTIFDLRGWKVTRGWRNYITRSFIICTRHQILRKLKSVGPVTLGKDECMQRFGRTQPVPQPGEFCGRGRRVFQSNVAPFSSSSSHPRLELDAALHSHSVLGPVLSPTP